MISYPLPRFEQQKSEVMQRYRILNGSSGFDASHTAKTAALVFGVPIVLAAVNERYRPWFRSSHGVSDEVFDQLQDFCSLANLSDIPFVVTDAREEDYFKKNIAVLGKPNVAFFAGAPLRDPDGQRLGTLCLIDQRPRTMDPQKLAVLESFAGLLSSDLCVRSAARYAVRDLIDVEEDKCTLYDLAMTDPLTRSLNRRAFFHFAEREVRRANRHGLHLSTMMIDIDHFKQ
ncbi:MAG: diguanylate cyclase, partial [Pseudomonadota bacterium]